MDNELFNIYSNFNGKNFSVLFEKLIVFINKYEKIFIKHTAKDLYNKVRQFKSQDFILGHSEDDFEELIAYYKNMLKQLDEKKICSQVIQLIWDISAYMLDEICPNCHYSNLRLTSSIDEKDTVKFCDECLYTSINNNYVEIDDEIIPANKKQVSAYLNSIRTKD